MKNPLLLIAATSALLTLSASADEGSPTQQPVPAPVPAQPAAVVTPAVAPKREEEAPAAPAASGTPPPKASLGDRIKALMTGQGAPELLAQVRTLTTERDQLLAQVGTLTGERDNARRELSEVENALNGQRNVVKATAATIAESVGQPLDALPAPIGEDQNNSGQDVVAQWKAAHDRKDYAKRDELFAKHKAAIWAAAEKN